MFILEEVKGICEKYLKKYYSSWSLAKNHKGRAKSACNYIQKCDTFEEILFIIKNELRLFGITGANKVSKSFGNNKPHLDAYCASHYAQIVKNRSHRQFNNSAYVKALHTITMILLSKRTILFSCNCLYKNAIIQFCASVMIPYIELKKSPDPWACDYLIETKKSGYPQMYIRNRDLTFAEKAPYVYTSFHLNTGKCVEKGYKLRVRSEEERNLRGLRFKNENFVHRTDRALEGGNRFVVYNTKGEKCVLIGRRVLLFDDGIKKQKKPGYEMNISREIERYKRLFNAKRVIIIPSLSYHIDLQMCYLGHSTFLINSLCEIERHFTKHYYDCDHWEVAGICKNNADIIIELLERNYLIGRTFAGSLYKPGSDLINCVWRGKNAISSFVNGFDIYGAWKDCFYYVTLDSPVDEHKRYFINLIKGLIYEKVLPRNFELFFVKGNNMTAQQTIKETSRRGGGLRCQVSLVGTKHIDWSKK